MNISENIRIAIYSIKSNKMRAFLTMLGIIIGVASVISIITIGNSSKEYIVNMIRAIGGQSVNISVKTGDSISGDSITDADIETLRNNDMIEYVSPMITDFGTISTQETSGFGMIMGSNEDMEKIIGTKIIHGRFFSRYEYESQRPVAVIDSDAAKSFFGTENVVGKSIDAKINDNTVSFKIVGVCLLKASEAMGNSSAISSILGSASSQDEAFGRLYIPATVLVQNSEHSEYNNCYITTKNVEDLDKAGEIAVNLLYSRHNNFDREVYSAQNMATMVDLLDTVINVFTAFITAVGAISLIVGGIGVMNIMMVSVTERTREIGIRKALGARTGTILLQFLTESVIICLIGGIIGMGLGFGLSYSVSSYMGVPVRMQILTILIAVGFSSAIGIFFGIYPARKAAKMPPIEALRRE